MNCCREVQLFAERSCLGVPAVVMKVSKLVSPLLHDANESRKIMRCVSAALLYFIRRFLFTVPPP